MFWMTNRWLLLNFDALGGLSVLVATLFSITILTNGAGWAGLCITSAMTFTMSGRFLVNMAFPIQADVHFSLLGMSVLDR